MGARFRIRVAEPDDAARLEVLERRCFSDPWSRAGLREMLESRQVVARLAQSGKQLAGDVFARWAADTGEIMNLAVAPEFRR